MASALHAALRAANGKFVSKPLRHAGIGMLAFTASLCNGNSLISVQRLRLPQRDRRSSIARNKQAHHVDDSSGKQQRLPQP